MDEQMLNQILVTQADKYPYMSLLNLKSQILNSGIDPTTLQMMMAQAKDPILVLILSIFLGGFGVDRFYIGDIGLGFGKLLTCGGLYFWWLIDLFLIMDATKEKNLQQLTMSLSTTTNRFYGGRM
ncbi:MAG: TM2 domain-containing protein [Prevotella sp.]|nr:TM2 domain-containing protein [Prevotella sp.]